MKTAIALFTLCASAYAQPAITPPQIGFSFDAVDSFRPILGLAGNFLIGPPALGGVTNAAFSVSYGLVKTDTAVIATSQQGQPLATFDAPAGPAAFAFQSGGTPAYVYLPAAHLLLQWTGTTFQMVPFNSGLFPAGSVRAIFTADYAHVGILVQRVDGLWDIRIQIRTGESDSQTVLSGVHGPALVMSSGELIFTRASAIVIRKTDGSEVHLAAELPSSFSLAQMGAGWAILTDSSTGAQLAVRVTAGRESVYSLPKASR
jgi:hypothetical protein